VVSQEHRAAEAHGLAGNKHSVWGQQGQRRHQQGPWRGCEEKFEQRLTRSEGEYLSYRDTYAIPFSLSPSNDKATHQIVLNLSIYLNQIIICYRSVLLAYKWCL
jgi:hypothetical protein